MKFLKQVSSLSIYIFLYFLLFVYIQYDIIGAKNIYGFISALYFIFSIIYIVPDTFPINSKEDYEKYMTYILPIYLRISLVIPLILIPVYLGWFIIASFLTFYVIFIEGKLKYFKELYQEEN